MNRLDMAAMLIIGHEYELAIEMLKKEESVQALYWLSLLYRLFDQYEEEKIVVDIGLASNTPELLPYFSKRKHWHGLDMHSKTVARQSLHMPRNPWKIPDPEDIKKMCFVTGGSVDYYPLIVEAIESIRATAAYKDCDVFVFDCGLTAEQKKYLLDIFLV